jgi:hypothetical protein
MVNFPLRFEFKTDCTPSPIFGKSEAAALRAVRSYTNDTTPPESACEIRMATSALRSRSTSARRYPPLSLIALTLPSCDHTIDVPVNSVYTRSACAAATSAMRCQIP